jgi:hypothetical protein
LSDKLPEEPAGLPVGFEPQLFLKDASQLLVATDHGAAQAECRFGLHRQSGEILVIGLLYESALGACERLRRVAGSEIGVAASLEKLEVECM